MGLFNLVRFRSIPGSAKDIGSVFLAMAIGLATGMGFIWLAVVFTVIVAVVNVAYVASPFGKQKEPEKTLRITIPEDLEYDGVFDEALARYTDEHELTEVQTTTWEAVHVGIRHPPEGAGLEKRLIDDLRCLNGNPEDHVRTRGGGKGRVVMKTKETAFGLLWGEELGQCPVAQTVLLARNVQSSARAKNMVCEQSTGLFAMRNSLGGHRPNSLRAKG